MGFAPRCFWSLRVRLTFSAILPWSPFEEFQKMADFGVFAKLAIDRNCGQFWSRGLRQNVVQWLHFKRILINGACDGLLFQPFAPRWIWCFWSLRVAAAYFLSAYHSGALGPRRHFEEFQKMADFGVFAKLAIARNCGHFCSRGLRQNVVQWLHFKRILINGRWDLRRGVFGACEFGLLFRPFCLGTLLWRISKNGRDYTIKTNGPTKSSLTSYHTPNIPNLTKTYCNSPKLHTLLLLPIVIENSARVFRVEFALQQRFHLRL